MDNKVLDIYNLLKKREFSNALQLAQRLYSFERNKENFALIKAYAVCCALNSQNYQAYNLFLKANDLKQRDYEVVINLATLAIDVGEYSQCLDFASIALQIQPESHIAYFALSKLYFATKEFDLSLENILQSIKLLRGNLSEIILKHDELVLFYFDILLANQNKNLVIKLIKDIEDDRGFLEVLFHYKSLNLPETVNEIDIENAKKILNERNTFNNLQFNKQHYQFKAITAHLLFSLGRYFAKKNLILSDQYFINGNQILLSAQRFRPLEHQKRTLKLINNFLISKNLKIKNANKGEGLIFITGLPRSGTTLMESILGSNEQTFAAGELDIFDRSLPEGVEGAYSIEQLEKIGDNYLNKIQFLKRNYKFFIDKMPSNNEYIGLISITLPGAKIIHMNRNLWEVATSQFQQFYFRNVPYSSSFFGIAITAANIEELSKVYSQFVPKNNLLHVSYEELVSNSENLIPQIYKFCNINTEYDQLARLKHVSKTASTNQVKSEINLNSIQKENFANYKAEFWKNVEMQRAFWRNNSPCKPDM